ncbi:MFS transporter [Alicyclobacillus shizuokensis]|uniref:MFS transporter n=1 Tax=Alicyclobacillus shizuokensis TaxID=392014 RepID=UPI000AA2CE32|nr:MFS transporter [Alicyclobacillus shizuokensis]
MSVVVGGDSKPFAGVQKNVTGYVVLLTVLGTLSVLTAGFDQVSRNVSFNVVQTQLHISLNNMGLITSGNTLMTCLAQFLIGPIIDRLGRKRGLQILLLVSGLFSGLTAFVTGTVQFGIFNFLGGAAVAVPTAAECLLGEEAPAKVRGLLMGIIVSGFSMAAVLVSFVSAPILDMGNWRLLFLLGFAPIVVAILIQFLVRETFRFSELQQKRKAALETRTSDDLDLERPSWRHLFTPELRRQTVVVSLAGFFLNFANSFILVLGVEYFVVFDHLNTPDAVHSIAFEGIGALIGQVICGWIADRIPSRHVMVFFQFCGGVALFLFHWHGSAAFIWTLSGLVGLFAGGAVGSYGRYVAESFPTRVRGTGSTFAWGVYSLSAVPAPTVFTAVMSSGHPALVPVLCAILIVIGAIVFLFGRLILPNKELEEITN